ncbi:MAG: ATP-dependent Clp protease adapter ClpS [Vicinamibacteria bacterium]
MANETPRNDVLERTETVKKEKKTPPYRVLLMNDDYTPMEFVVEVLMGIFGKGEQDAVQIMLKVHVEGSGLAGVYPFEIAETKVEEVLAFARAEGHPLKATMEEGEA